MQVLPACLAIGAALVGLNGLLQAFVAPGCCESLWLFVTRSVPSSFLFLVFLFHLFLNALLAH